MLPPPAAGSSTRPSRPPQCAFRDFSPPSARRRSSLRLGRKCLLSPYRGLPSQLRCATPGSLAWSLSLRGAIRSRAPPSEPVTPPTTTEGAHRCPHGVRAPRAPRLAGPANPVCLSDADLAGPPPHHPLPPPLSRVARARDTVVRRRGLPSGKWPSSRIPAPPPPSFFLFFFPLPPR